MSLRTDPCPEATFWIKMIFLKSLCVADHFRGKRRKGHKVAEIESIGPSSVLNFGFVSGYGRLFPELTGS